MKSKYHIIIVLLFICSSGCSQKNTIKSALVNEIVETVQENHISPKELDDELSKQVFDAFFYKIDPDKQLFNLDEINQLKLAEKSLDDELKNGSTLFYTEAIDLLFGGIKRAEKYANEYLEHKIEIFKEESVESNQSKLHFVNNEALKERWGLNIKKQFNEELYLTEIVNPTLTFEEQKRIALEKTKVFYRDYFYKMTSLTGEELFEQYINAYLSCNDYQSTFLSPKSKAKWDSEFNRTFVGVGLSIETTMDYPEINDIVFDGPAWKTKKINRGDILMKVSNEENQLIDVAGLPLKKVIDLLKGTKGSKVTVRIKNSKNNIEDVVIERGQVLLSKTMSFVIKDKKDKAKIGYIYLPRFYSSGEGSAQDLLNELQKLISQEVDGVILDLRNNQGGSAREAREIVGYFLNGGATMQMVSKENLRKFEDEDTTAQYSGKLIVMVNEKSSSASELLSGTLQDYNKAVIVGSQTFGKGTVQNFFEIIDEETSTKFGDIKLTIAKFYTGNGRTSQYNGIVPDIVLPSDNRHIKTGERVKQNALQFKNLEPIVTKKNDNFEQSLYQLEKLSKARQAKNVYFQQVEKKALLKKKSKTHSLVKLNYKDFKKEKENSRGHKVLNTPDEKIVVISTATSNLEIEKNEYWKLKLENDEYLFESILIMQNYLELAG